MADNFTISMDEAILPDLESRNAIKLPVGVANQGNLSQYGNWYSAMENTLKNYNSSFIQA